MALRILVAKIRLGFSDARSLSSRGWVLACGAMLACGGSSISKTNDGAPDAGATSDDDGGPSGASGAGGTSGSSATGGGKAAGGVPTAGAPTGGSSTGGRSTGGTDPTGGTGGVAGSDAQGGLGGAGTGAQGGISGTGGSGGSGAFCSAVPPCGGDVVGAWSVGTMLCDLAVTGEVDLTGFGLGCDSALVSGYLQVSGALLVGSDGNFEDYTITAGEEMLELAPQCLLISGTATTCERIGAPLQSLGFASVSCVSNVSTNGCTCRANANQEGGMALISLDAATMSTYTVTGESLITTAFDLDTEYSYCVSGDTMSVSLETKGRVGTVMGSVKLQKQ